MQDEDANFFVGNVPVYGNVILAPMAGYSDIPYRALCRAFGSAMHYTEFVASEMLLTRRPNHSWNLLNRKEGEHPMVFQIFGNDPQKLLQAAQKIESWGPDIIDINMGCSTRRVSGRGAGVGMMRSPEKIAETFALLSQHISIPVTGKIRLGWDDMTNYVEVGRILEDNGAALVAMHGRTKEQKYGGRANWDSIAELKQALSIPVIGNGDITVPADIDKMLTYTGCDAVMVGRGAIGNPWIFDRRQRHTVSLRELVDTILLHLDEMLAYYAERGIILFRKHLNRYLSDVRPAQPFLVQMKQAKTRAELVSLLSQLLEQVTHPELVTLGELMLEDKVFEAA